MSIFTFARLEPGTTQLHEIGRCTDRASAEHRGHREMIAAKHTGGVVIEHLGDPEHTSRVVSIANVEDFRPIDDEYLHLLSWWHGLSDATKQRFASGSLDLSDGVQSDVGASALMYGSGGQGPDGAQLSDTFADFVGAIVGEDAPWVDTATLPLFRA